MKKSAVFPILCLTLAVVACGKKNDTPVDTTVQASSAPYVQPIGSVPPPGWTGDLNSWCTSMQQMGYSASMSNGVCRVSSTFNYTLYMQFGTVGSQVYVMPGDRITTTLSNSAQVWVGGVQYGSGNTSFVSTNYGQLGFKSSNFNWSFTVGVRQDRCYTGYNTTTNCP